jgi:acyl-CoA synthetase (AMP-forming)/AMP-acid ligase II
MMMGLKKGDKIAVLFVNNVEICECYYGIAKMGGVVVPLNLRLSPREYQYEIDFADCKAVIFGEIHLEVISSIRPQLPKVEHYICVTEKDIEGIVKYEEVMQEGSSEEPEVPISGEDDAFIIFTAGTTGMPKGVVRTHQNQLMGVVDFLEMTAGMSDEFDGGKALRFLSVPPMFHAATQQAFHCVLFLGGTNIFCDGFAPDAILESMDKGKANGVWAVPVLWRLLLMSPKIDQYDLSRIKLVANGAAIMPLEEKKALMRRFPNAGLMDVFGQTEMGPWTCTLRPQDALKKPDSVGKPCSMVHVRLWDDRCRDVPIGEVGEIVYYGPTLMKGYYKDAEATAEAMTGGYFHSGDLCRMDEEGYVYVVDRKKDMIITGGENVYPAEVEAVLLTHPKIQQGAVVGLPHPKWREAVTAVVTLKTGETVTEEEIINYCKDRIAHYKAPKAVEFTDMLPLSGTGKVLRRELRDRYKQI